MGGRSAGKGNPRRPQAVMMSKRANVFYLEHVRVMQKDERIVYLTEARDGVQQFVSIPDRNTAFVLLGKGTSITDSAARKLSESNVMIGFCGSGGSPLVGVTDAVFMAPQDEYRPTQYAQRWFALWSDEASRLEVARTFLRHRSDLDRTLYAQLDIDMPAEVFEVFDASVDRCASTTDLLVAEAHFAKKLYHHFARLHRLGAFSRDHGAGKSQTDEQRINGFLDHGNYLAYGYAAVALHTMGIPFFLPVLHGKTRRGALVFDVADLVKDWLVMPAAFLSGAKGEDSGTFRSRIIDLAIQFDVLDQLMTFVGNVVEIDSSNQ